MNPLFYPGEKPEKHQIERHKKLVKGKEDKSIEKYKENIPNDWFYNTNKAQELWDELEASVQKHEILEQQENPFTLIDEAAERIKKIVSKFEEEDMELANKIRALDDANGGMMDEGNVLMEARLRLFRILNDHSKLSDKQISILDSLKYWFNDLNGKRNDSDLTYQSDIDHFDLAALHIYLESLSKQKESAVEKANTTHQEIIENLTHKVQECQAIIHQKEMQIHQMETTSLDPKLARRARRSLKFGDKFTSDDEYQIALRQIVELNSQVDSLKKALTQNPEEQRAVLERIESQEKFLPDLENDDRITELEAKIILLQEELQGAREENKFIKSQVARMKQSELVHDKKIATLEKKKDSLEISLKNANNKIELQTQEIESARSAKSARSFDAGDDILKITRHYEDRIDEMAAQHRAAMTKLAEDSEKRLKDFITAAESGEGGALIQKSRQIYEHKLEQQKEESNKALADQKKRSQAKFMVLVNSYEKMIAQKDDVIADLKISNEQDIDIRLKTQQVEFEEKLNQHMLEYHQKTSHDFAQMRFEFTKKIDSLNSELLKAKQERDSLKAVIDAHELYQDILDDEEDSEEKDLDNPEDDILLKSLAEMREREFEAKIMEKYNLLMNSQKDIFVSNKQWEVESIKKTCREEHTKNVNELRKRIIQLANNINQNLTSEGNEALENMIQQLIKILTNNEDENKNMLKSKTMINAEEVDYKFDQLRQKLLELLNENEIWKLAFDRLDPRSGNKTENEILDAIKGAINTQATKLAAVEQENQSLKRKLNLLSSQEWLSSIDTKEGKGKGKVVGSPRSTHSLDYTESTKNRPKRMKFVTHYIFQVSPGSKSKIFLKEIGEPLPNRRFDVDCICVKCKESFPFNRKKVIDRNGIQTIQCPHCHIWNEVVFLDHAIECGYYSKLIREIKDLKFANSVLSANQRSASDTYASNARNQAYKMFVQTSQLLVDSVSMLPEEDVSITMKGDALAKIAIGLKDVKAPEEEQLTKEIEDVVKAIQGNKSNEPKELDQLLNKLKTVLAKVGDLTYQPPSMVVKPPQHTQFNSNEITVDSDAHHLPPKLQLGNTGSLPSKVQQRNQKQMQGNLSLSFDANISDLNLTSTQPLFEINMDVEPPKQKVVAATSRTPVSLSISSPSKFIIDDFNGSIIKAKDAESIKQNTARILSDNDLIRVEVKELLAAMLNMLSSTRKKVRAALMSSDRSDELRRLKNSLESERTAREERDRVNGELTARLAESTAALERMSVEQASRDELSKILSAVEGDEKAAIDELVQKIIKVDNDNHALKKEALQLKQDLEIALDNKVINSSHNLHPIRPFLIFSTDSESVPPITVPKGPMSPPSPTSPTTIQRLPNPSPKRKDSSLSAIAQKLTNSKAGTPMKSPKNTIKTPSRSKSILQKNGSPPSPLSPKSPNYSVMSPKSPLYEPTKVTRTYEFANVEEGRPNFKDGNGSVVVYVTRFQPGSNDDSPKIDPPRLAPIGLSQTHKHTLQTKAAEAALESVRSAASEKKSNDMIKRIHRLEEILKEQTAVISEYQDKVHEFSQIQFQNRVESDKILRLYKKEKMLHESTRNRLIRAIKMIEARDNDLAVIRKLNTTFTSIAAKIKIHHFKGRKWRPQDVSYDEEINRIMQLFADIPGLERMAERQVRALARWKARREEIIESQRVNLMRQLDAMRFLFNPNADKSKTVPAMTIRH